MSIVPDYELASEVFANTPEQLKALAHPLRSQILDLVLERAATVSELAVALERPKSSVAHHVDSLLAAGMLTVVRTRKVRAIEERFYGRTGRTIVLGDGPLPKGAVRESFLATALDEAGIGPEVQATLRHARVPLERADELFARLNEIAEEFTTLPRSGDTVFGLLAAVYPTDHPSLPPEESS